MTISSTTREVSFIGNGIAATFNFPFKIFKASDLFVTTLDPTTGLQSVLILNTDYSVILNANQDSLPGGSLSLVAGPLATGFGISITSDVPNLQPTELTNQGGFYPEVITTALDRLTILIQQLQEQIDANVKNYSSSPVLPSGAVNGIGATGNRMFTLPIAAVNPTAAMLILNRSVMLYGKDYLISGTSLAYTTPLPPQIGDKHVLFYS